MSSVDKTQEVNPLPPLQRNALQQKTPRGPVLESEPNELFKGQPTLGEVTQFWQEHRQQINAEVSRQINSNHHGAPLGEGFQQIFGKLCLVLGELQSHPAPQAIHRTQEAGSDTLQETIYLTENRHLVLSTITNSDNRLVRVSEIYFSDNQEQLDLTLGTNDPRSVAGPSETKINIPRAILHQGEDCLLIKLIIPHNNSSAYPKKVDSVTIVTREDETAKSKKTSSIAAHLGGVKITLDPITLSS